MEPGAATQTVNFWELFQVGVGNTLITKKSIIVNGVLIPAYAVIHPGNLIAGVDFHQRRGYNLAVEDQNGAAVIRGFYPPAP